MALNTGYDLSLKIPYDPIALKIPLAKFPDETIKGIMIDKWQIKPVIERAIF